MFEQYVSQIVTWNRDRGLLVSFDPGLSMKLLSEEAKEFFKAETLPEMLCEYADFWFVWHGYRAISSCSAIHPVGLEVAVNSMGYLENWRFNVDTAMRDLLLSEYKKQYPEDNVDVWQMFNDDANKAMEFVIHCNEMKSSKKNSDGKIVKADGQLSPVPMMEGYLESRHTLKCLKPEPETDYDDVQGY